MVKRTLTILSDTRPTSRAFESKNFDHPPYNGYTLFRPIFDSWYAQKARDAGASLRMRLPRGRPARRSGAVSGVRVGERGGELSARYRGLRRRPLAPRQEDRARPAA